MVAPGAWKPAAAHTEVLRASPAPGEEITGTVDRVELTFLDPVQPDVSIVVGRAIGEPVAGIGTVEVPADGRSASVAFPALDDSGDYVVEYRFTALDGDTQRETYRFTLLPVEDDGGSSAGAGAVIGGLAIVVVLTLGVLTATRRRARAE